MTKSIHFYRKKEQSSGTKRHGAEEKDKESTTKTTLK
jgi:hypothetical protein